MTALAALLSSCVYDNSRCPVGNDGSEYILRLNIVAESAARTRASEHTEHKGGDDAEKFIAVSGSDYCIYLLDADGRLKQRFEPTSMTLESERDDSDRLVYKLTGSFIPDMERMYVMVMANWNAFGGTYASHTILGRFLADLYGDDESFNFEYMPAVTNGTATSWSPSIEAGEGIPMFGISKAFAVTKDGQNTVQAENVNMLRALTKIEIADLTPAEDNIEILGCRLTNYNTSGRFIPDGGRSENAGWDDEKDLVASPSLPAGGNTLSSSTLNLIKSADGKSFTAYVPEMDLSELSGDSRPKLEVEISADGRAAKWYTIEFADYKDGKADEDHYFDHLLRNHWYQFNITKVEVGVLADLTIYINDYRWTTSDDEWTYDDLKAEFAPDGAFRWTASSFEESADDLTTPQRTLLVTPDGGAEATFSFVEPARGRWVLALYAGDGTRNDAFRIDLWDPARGEWIIGTDTELGSDVVNGVIAKGDEEPATVRIRISATREPDSETSFTARLAMTVTTFDDRIMEVNLPWFVEHPDRTDSGDMPAPSAASNDYYYVKQAHTGF